jgi:Na+/proline symporter
LGNQILPSGLKAIFFCGLIGTTLSAMVGYTLVSGATFGREFVARLRPELKDADIKNWTRVGFALSCVVAVGISFAVRNVAVDLWYAYSGAVVGALLLPVTAVYVPKIRLNASSFWATASMLAGFITSFAWLIWCKRTDNLEYKVSISGQEITLGTLVPGLIVSAMVLCLGEISGRKALKT